MFTVSLPCYQAKGFMYMISSKPKSDIIQIVMDTLYRLTQWWKELTVVERCGEKK